VATCEQYGVRNATQWLWHLWNPAVCDQLTNGIEMPMSLISQKNQSRISLTQVVPEYHKVVKLSVDVGNKGLRWLFENSRCDWQPTLISQSLPTHSTILHTLQIARCPLP
jgi:hypothetical protein